MSNNLPALLASIRALTQSIRNIIGIKLDKTERAADSALLEGKTFAQHASGSRGMNGELLFINKDNVSMSFSPSALVTELRKAPSDVEIARMKSNEQLMADVFSKWKRTSHNATGVYPAVPAELDKWAYDAPTDSVSMTYNSGSMLGLISPYEYSEYVFDYVVKSAGNDDDSLGMILGFKSEGGVETTFVCGVSTGGYMWNGYSTTDAPCMYIVVNLHQGAANGLKLIFKKDLGLTRQMFKGADFVNGIRITAKRMANDTMEVQVRRPDGTNWPAGEIKWTGEIPDAFKGKAAVGYYALSQPLSTYVNITVPQPKTDIIDSRNDDVHRWNNTTQTWVIAGKASAVLPKGRLYKNTEGALDTSFLTLEGNFINVGSPGNPVDKVPVSELITLATGATKQYDLQTLLGATYAAYDLARADITVLAKDTNPASPLYNAYANAQALVVYGLKDNRYVIVANQSGAPIDIYVKVLVSPLAV